ncbi:MAG: hypothetical protein FJW38_11635 [Acidobacteria bacterium]|nr:hypothetical protein [Acidobacteriota bacterium]
MSVLKKAAAVIAGFIVASIVMMIVEFINGRVLYPDLAKAAEGVTDPEVIRGIMARAPVGAFLVVLLGWLLGGLAGGWSATRIAGDGSLRCGVILGALLTLAGVANNLMLPPPLWFWVASLLVLFPSAYFGARLAK